ncbi:Maltase-glucoamylase, intestinal [Armadillidium nasatum]|uniref:Maltase-glucoamylase, intestinal n=1 Tax=Armadillidium nasatum TaxID=96803 RepID=A0A5N5SM11_9CRUS|nr:Maltase-glucoamylase, intestinal [Armadillidium nasatum]
MEFSTFSLGEYPSVTTRTIGGILDIHLFLGPTPEDVNIQFANFVGNAEFPPYWAFGFHLSRYGYNSLDNYQVVYDRMIAAQIPWDSQTFDIDYMERRRDFTYDTVNFAGLPEFAEILHNNSMKLILMFDPALVIDFDNYPPSQRGKDYDVFIKWESSDLIPDDQPEGTQDYVVGYVWPDNKTVFPDFFNPVTADWWANEIALFHKEIPFDGIWIDMNEPSNFGTNTEKPFNWPDDLPPWSLKCPNNTREDPPYATLAAFSNENECKRISDKTICMSTVQTDGINTYSHYDVHNLYGFKEIVATHTRAMTTTINPGERPFILTRSAYPGAGHYTAHWTGDNSATWDQLKSSIIDYSSFRKSSLDVSSSELYLYSNYDEAKLLNI